MTAPAARALLELRSDALHSALRGGHAIDPAALEGWVYRGVSLNLPAWVDRLAWKTFAKCFVRDDRGLRGWNVRLVQTGRLDGPLVARTRRGSRAPLVFGHFIVSDAARYTLPRRAAGGLPPGALLLDYGRGGNPRLDPSGLLRDPLVALAPGSADALLGWSYLELGFARVGTPSFFVLERAEALEDFARPPRAAG